MKCQNSGYGWAITLLAAVNFGCSEPAGPAVAVGDTAGASDAGADAGVAADTAAAAETSVAEVDAAVAETGDAVASPGDSAPPDVAAADVAPAVCTADEVKKCNDGLPCTIDSCNIVGGVGAVCKWAFVADACLINGLCKKKGDAKPSDACAQCLPEAATTTWSVAPDSTSCDDGDLCTYQGKCAGKKCASVAVPCGDGNACTADTCDPKKGCVYPPLSATTCDDGSACTNKDSCISGACIGDPVTCNDSNPCSDDACNLAKGCTSTLNSAPCSDGDACTADDGCSAGTCKSGGAPNCDDGNSCTLDFCDKGAGCYHLPLQSPCCIGETSICDDANPCTSDDCDPKTSKCGHANNTAVCNDANACTASDTCKGGKCAGSTKLCDDKNPCTSDACAADKGCLFSPAGTASCDDGNVCTTSDVCSGGVCKGAGQCTCKPVFAAQAIKFNSILIGDGGQPGEGIDLDDNPKTCAPASNCSAGINNALGALAGLANPPFDKAVKDGSVTFVVEFKDFKQGPVNLALYAGKLDPGNVGCDSTKATCNYLVDIKMLDPQKCLALVLLPGQLAGDLLSAGGKGTNFPIAIPLQPGVNLNVTIFGAKLVGKVGLSGGNVTSFDGILSGSVPKATLLAAIDALPEAGLPIPKDGIKAILDGAVDNDIDSDGDGKLDAASIALKVKGGAAKITGTY